MFSFITMIQKQSTLYSSRTLIQFCLVFLNFFLPCCLSQFSCSSTSSFVATFSKLYHWHLDVSHLQKKIFDKGVKPSVFDHNNKGHWVRLLYLDKGFNLNQLWIDESIYFAFAHSTLFFFNWNKCTRWFPCLSTKWSKSKHSWASFKNFCKLVGSCSSHVTSTTDDSSA